MKPHRKPNAKSPLQLLTEDRQAEIIELLKTKSQPQVRKHLAEDGIKVSLKALSGFWSWWFLRHQYQQTESDVQTLQELWRKSEPGISEDDLFRRGQTVFSLLAMKKEDAKDWSRIQKLRQNEQRTQLESRRIAILEKKAAAFDQAKEIVESQMSPAE